MTSPSSSVPTEASPYPRGEPTSDFPLGEPPRDDVEGAARLLLRYDQEHPLDPDRAQMFIMMVLDKGGVMKRYRELKAEQQT